MVSRTSIVVFLALLSLAVAAACGDDDAATPSASSAEPSSPPASQPSSPPASQPSSPPSAPSTDSDAITVEMQLVDFMTNAGIANAPATIDGVATTTDDDGILSVRGTADTDYAITLDAADYPAFVGYQRIPPFSTSSLAMSIPASSSIGLLGTALGIQVDPDLAIVTVSALAMDRSAETFESLAGVTIDIDATYEIALRTDSGSPLGLSEGNTTAPDSAANVIFVNVEPGIITPSFTTPNGEDCTYGPGSGDAPAGAFVIIGHRCE